MARPAPPTHVALARMLRKNRSWTTGVTVIRFCNQEVLQETEAIREPWHGALTPALSQREREKGGSLPSSGA